MDSCKPVLSDHLARLATSSSETFPFFYRGLVRLHFPIDVAEILEFRYLSHQLIDKAADYGCEYVFDDFTIARKHDLIACGITKPAHSDRLLQLVRLIRHFHDMHLSASEEKEKYLRNALEENIFARRHSRRYGRSTGLVTLASLAGAAIMSPPATLMECMAGVFGYLCADYFYSLSLLRREERALQEDLDEVLRRRVRRVNWRAVVRQTGVILGYTQPPRGEAFRLEQEEEAHEMVRDFA